MTKLPWFAFFPGDWLKDPALSRCSLAGRGVWIDVLCLMFECEDRGVLSTGGTPWTDQEIAEALRGDTAANLACIRELLEKGVAHRNSSGAIFSKRLVRDEQARASARDRKAQQRERSSNDGCHAPCHAEVTSHVTLRSQGSSSSVSPSSSTAECAQHTPGRFAPEVCEQAIAIWNEHCGSLPQVQKLTVGRRKKILARLKTNPEFLEIFRDATKKAACAPFLRGEGPHGWKASFDWLTANDENALRVVEGAYDSRLGGGHGATDSRGRDGGRSNGKTPLTVHSQQVGLPYRKPSLIGGGDGKAR